VPTALRALLLAVVFTVVPVVVGVLMTGGSSAPAKPPAYSGTALRDFDSSSVTIARGAFCDRLPSAAVSAALGTGAKVARGYDSGQRASVGAGSSDVMHEYGCTYAAGPAQAHAWVFAPPVSESQAHTMIGSLDKGCQRPKSAAAFGSPTMATVCGTTARTATYRGLFGDAWLSCSLTLPKGKVDETALVDRAGRWCVAVAQAASS